ncbi:hypothetical protein WJX72_010967 [[Myrmecia] bisecta]|uniref:TLC domain-containing protein n=1 Tax=[Myrmecia] bisecta TaxID=41462 RepID=A0AAW1QTU4_9CHLO
MKLPAYLNINYPNDEWNWHFLDGGVGDVAFAGVLACLYPVLRFVLDTVVFKPAAEYFVLPNTKKSDEPPTPQQRLTVFKFQESAWKAVIYVSFAALAMLASYNERFLTDRHYFWKGCKGLPCNYNVSKLIRLLYCLELGFYAQAIPVLLFWEVRRKDFWANLGHHLATLILIGYSFLVNFTKVGTMVFLVHDVNDIFMEMAKMTRYAGKNTATTALFVLFVISWFTTRITIFPVHVLRSTLFDASEMIGKKYGISPHPHWEIFNGFLFFLFGLHIYWSYLILRIALRQLREGKTDDIREEDDDSD